MHLFLRVCALACVLVLAAGFAVAQTPRLPDQARRAVVQPMPEIMTPVARASLASRLAREPVNAAEITDTVSVSVLAPVVGDPAAPTLAFSAQAADWETLGAGARIRLRDVSGSRIRLRMQTAAGHRHLVVCDMSGAGTMRMENAAWPGWTLTWEGREQGAVLLPAIERDAMQYIDFVGAGWIRSCEVSRLG